MASCSDWFFRIKVQFCVLSLFLPPPALFFFCFIFFFFVLTRYGLLYNYLVKFPCLCVIQLVYVSPALVGGMSVNHWESFVSVLYSISFYPACIGLFMIAATEITSCFPGKLGCRTQKASSPMLKLSRRFLTDPALLQGAEAAVGDECRRCCSHPVSTYLQVCCFNLRLFPNKSSIWTPNPLEFICWLCSVLKATYPHSKRMIWLPSHQNRRVIRSFDPQKAQCGSKFFKATP